MLMSDFGPEVETRSFQAHAMKTIYVYFISQECSNNTINQDTHTNTRANTH